jgi:O-antigen/teichoic acid export membrane protein
VIVRIARTFSTQVGATAVSIITGIFVARYLGPPGKGFVNYAVTAVALVTVFFNGFSDALLYQFGKQAQPARHVLAAALRIFAAGAAFFMLLFALVAWQVPSQRPLAAAAAALPFALFVQLSTPFLVVRERYSVLIVRAITQSAGTALLTIPLLMFTHLRLSAVIGAWVAFSAVAALQSAWGMRPIFAAPQPPSDASTADLARGQIRFGLRASAASAAGYLNLRIDVFVVSALLSAASLGYYTLAIASGEILWQVTRAFLWPAMGRIASEATASAAELVARLTRNILIIAGFGGIVAFAIGPWLIVHVYGAAFAPSGTALRFALPGLVVYAAEAALTQYIMLQLARPWMLIWAQLGSAAACAGITALTVGRYGIVAAAATTSLTYLAVTCVLVATFARSTGIPLARLLFVQAEDVASYRRVVSATLRRLRLAPAPPGA